jgi:hypothetical protein
MTFDINNLPPKRHLLEIRDRIVRASFSTGNWRELAILADFSEIITHPRLLRGLSFGDPDYSDSVLYILERMYAISPHSLVEVEVFLDDKFPDTQVGENISTKPSTRRRIVFSPTVFDIPEGSPDPLLISVMMPFSSSFDLVYQAISGGVTTHGGTCLRASDIWEHSTVIQDIFSLIFRSTIVICDFTGKNPNVFYEAGIAHTLGKQLIPITQNDSDIPFDIAHHRYIKYLANSEGLTALIAGIQARLWSLNFPF